MQLRRICSPRGWRLIACLPVALILASLLSVVPARAENSADYRFIQLTDHVGDDQLARVSSGSSPLLVWLGKFGLPGAQSASSDFEIMLWDGRTLEQLTDDAVDDTRPVVNARREVAWMKNGLDEESEIYTRYWTSQGELVHRRVTNDGVRDRYPDINNAGIVTWGRGVWNRFAVYELGEENFLFDLGIPWYRPHINAQGHMIYAARTMRDRYGNLVFALDASAFGYHQFVRAEINDLDQMLIEALKEPGSTSEGPHDMLFWDGTTMRLILESDVYVGRGDLNNDGVAAFEGRGGLPSSESGQADREIFVYLAQTDELFQLTDNDVDDSWPTVTADGTIIWDSNGLWEGATRGQFTGTVEGQCCEDLMAALPLHEDYDKDGVPNRFDNCPVTYNVTELDTDGDGVGDACDGSCQGFTHVRDCGQAVVNVGRVIPEEPVGGCNGGGGTGSAASLAPLFGLSLLHCRRRVTRRRGARI